MSSRALRPEWKPTLLSCCVALIAGPVPSAHAVIPDLNPIDLLGRALHIASPLHARWVLECFVLIYLNSVAQSWHWLLSSRSTELQKLGAGILVGLLFFSWLLIASWGDVPWGVALPLLVLIGPLMLVPVVSWLFVATKAIRHPIERSDWCLLISVPLPFLCGWLCV
jgi:hypothetical protein